jgi:hypothetical protein
MAAPPSLPVTAIWLLGVLLGIQLICEGVALGYLAWQVRQSWPCRAQCDQRIAAERFKSRR